ncbi:MAG: nucleoside 2-deoxyribosyltransferase [Candidatus Pacebacteria bacterium]|nr:nucleoside 2-deoxyribosyltransferase [Candidatus Paceibacterota bacterium]
MKKKIFLSYRITGENREELKIIMKRICQGIETAGFGCFYSFQKEGYFQENNFTKKQILEYALKEIDKTDCVLVIVKSQEKSEGMLLEVGYALAKNKKIVLAIKKDIQTVFLQEMANSIIEFENLDDLNDKLSDLKL